MGKKKQNDGSLGRSLIRDRFGSRHKNHNSSMLHTSELNDGYDWGRLNLQSVTEESSFQEFLSTAELAGTEFQAEKLNIKFVNPAVGIGLLSVDEKKKVEKKHSDLKNMLKIPRRPKWDSNMTPEELQTNEKTEFLEWRRRLATLQETEDLLLTPYEKNLDFWRQLWRVVERSDVVAQILDARNPLLFQCEDLERYVKEVDPRKLNLLILNKADFLTRAQRRAWARHFDNCQTRVAFFSATLAAEDTIPEQPESESEDEFDEPVNENDSEYETADEEEIIGEDESSVYEGKNSSKLLGRDELIAMFKQLLPQDAPRVMEHVTTIGLVGYPNVGKSSTINSILQNKKVSVSATPGKTKHFQTLYVDAELMLCDCPGLVMPSFVTTKAEMVLSGILPVDQMKDHVPPVNMLCSLIPRHVLEGHYSLMIPKPLEGEDEDRPPSAEELLNAYGYSRGFMTQNGQPDNPRSARYVLKDFLNGRLLYCQAPPGTDQLKYHTFAAAKKKHIAPLTQAAHRAIRVNKVSGEDLDKAFFKQASLGAHTKGISKVGNSSGSSVSGSTMSLASAEDKPWKNHKEKRNKREKLRRVYRHLDV
ncbi:large subunit GTPase 1 homolog [Macrosteles quadrilineatus]|uniref:large subunit GTPase 1 homolog n=1 Tax=Macrosteles quadrilineatus TaxID=74068 RepID=UPI0023E0B277|nr:large subunit GTPase 1 homolog [Macrosteles quadrilineatus]